MIPSNPVRRSSPAPLAVTVTDTPAESAPLLVVVVPCLDEEATVADVVAAVPRRVEGFGRVEVLVVDDGSSDATGERARAAGAQVLRHPQNLGLGRTFRDGVDHALSMGADAVVTIDGDGQFDPSAIPLLVAPLLAGEAHLVTASRFLQPDLVPDMPRLKRWGNRWVAWIVWVLTGLRFRDVSCGYRALSREALLRLNLFGGLTYTQETFLDLIFKGLRVVEVPVAVRGTREHGRSRVASNLPRYAAHALAIMLRSFVSYRPLLFFSIVATAFLAGGAGLLGFLLVHYLRTGAFSPHIWAGFVGGSFAFAGILALLMGVLGDLLVRLRLGQDQVLYLLERRAFRRRPVGQKG